jgi:hypothetical protein
LNLHKGEVAFAPESSALVWELQKLEEGTFILAADNQCGEPIEKLKTFPTTVRFESRSAMSGFGFEFVKVVEKSGYIASTFTRTLTSSNEYTFKSDATPFTRHLE